MARPDRDYPFPKLNGPTEDTHHWPESEDRFHEPLLKSRHVDGPSTIAINERNWIPCGDDEHREAVQSPGRLGRFAFGLFRDGEPRNDD